MQNTKYSGIDWIGNIPNDWTVIRGKFLFENLKEIVGENEQDYNRLALTMGGVIHRDKDDATGLQSAGFDTYQKVNPGDLILNLIDLENVKTSRVGLSPFLGIVSPVYIRLQPKTDEINIKFAEYFYLSLWYRNIFNMLGNGVRSNLTAKDLLEIPIVYPPAEQQKAIVNYLDEKIPKLDFLIETTEKSIRTLKDYKMARVSEAVSVGVSSNDKYINSGIDYLGEMPESWKVVRLKSILRPVSVKNHGSEQVLSLYRDYGVIPKDSRDDNWNVTSLDTNSYKFVRPGQLVINKMKAWQGSLAISKIQGIISPAYHLFEIVNDDVNMDFLHYSLRALRKVPAYRRLSAGMREGQWDLGVNDFLSMRIAMPDFQTQKNIVEDIEAFVPKIDKMIADKNSLIAELREYKKSIIYEMITGKKKV